jgi:hypothetical protein
MEGPCLICYAGTRKEQNADAPDEAHSPSSTLLQSQLVPLFLLKRVLRMSNDALFIELLSKHGNPSEWNVRVCLGCSNYVTEAKDIFQEIEVLERKLIKLKEHCETKILTSWELKSSNKNCIRKRLRNHRRVKKTDSNQQPVDIIREEIVKRN